MLSILFCWRTTSKTTERNSVLLTVRKCFGGMTFGLGSYLQGPHAVSYTHLITALKGASCVKRKNKAVTTATPPMLPA